MKRASTLSGQTTSPWADLPLRRKGLVVVAIPLAALLTTMISSLFAESQEQQAQAQVAHTLIVESELERAHVLLLKREVRVRGYLLTQRRIFLPPSDDARLQLAITLNHLRDLVQDNPAQMSAVSRIQALVKQKNDHTDGMIAHFTALLDRGDSTAARTTLVGPTLQSRILLLNIQQELAAMRGEEDRLLEQRLKRLNGEAVLSNTISLAGTLLGLLGGLAATLLFTTGVVQRVHALAQNAGLLAEGAPLAPQSPSHDELGVLAVRLEQASDLLRQREQDLQRAKQEAERAKQEAERANQAKSEFLSRMSHELRTPLNAILGFGQILQLDDIPGQRESIDYILKGGQHLLALINEVLDIARVEAGRMDLAIEPVLLSEVLRESLELVRGQALPQQIQMAEEMPAPCGESVLADRQRLRQVLLNLLSNAVKYNRPGGRVSVSCHAITLGRMRIEVRDTGPGITPEDLQKLFVPFERLHAGKSEVEGTGLGLALSRRLMEAMGGTLTADSVPGQGSTFSVELPLAPDTSEPMEKAPPSELEVDQAGAPQGSFTVLSIEDNLSNHQLIERILERRPGIKLLAAMQGGVGLDLARQHHPHLILLDLHLPDIMGWEVLRRLREEPATRDIPVVVVSADATPPQRERLLAAGAQAYLTKPLSVKEFLRVLDEWLQPPHSGD